MIWYFSESRYSSEPGQPDPAVAPASPGPGPGEYVVEDLLDGSRYTWRGAWNYVRLDPAERMAHVFVIRD